MDEEYRPAFKTFDEWRVSEQSRYDYDLLDCLCHACYVFKHFDNQVGLSMAVQNLPDWKLEKQVHESFKTYYASNCPKLRNLPKPKHHKGNGRPKGTWAGTLTMAPSDPYNEEDMVQAIRKLFKQETCPVEKYAWYVERTENDLPHVHFIYRTPDGGRIHAKVFKRVWKIWNEDIKLGAGHKGGYHRMVSDEDAYLKYIAKDGGRHDSNWTIN